MEKKTIGKFISALRRTKVMTQKELCEKLFGSDKTVSSWECDECTPELSLIPSIAEIFGVTTDELLRGERNNPDNATNAERTERQKAKSDKQFKLMLHNRKKKYSNLSFISIGLAIVGLIVAMICNLGFSKGLLGFCLASIFLIAATICQICFTVSFRLLIDEDEEEHLEKIKKANTDMALTSVKIFFVIWLVWAFCLPIAVLTLAYVNSNYGLVFKSWLLYGALFVAIAFIFAFCVYQFGILKLLIKKEIVYFNDSETEKFRANNKLLKKLCAIFITAFAVIWIALYILSDVIGMSAFIKKQRFDDPDAFIETVQTQYDEWVEETLKPHGGYPNRKIGEIDGKEYYYNPDLYQWIHIGQYENGEYDIVITMKDVYQSGKNTYDILHTGLRSLYAIDLFVCIGWYCIRKTK